MCGIACVAGGKNSGEFCYKALEKLEYRGYDSAGIAYLDKGEIKVFKQEGCVKNIEQVSKDCKSKLVITHTRWATHGKPSQINAHPHLSYDKSIAVVHNGIIENHQDIKNKLKGFSFVSETDTECVANLIASKSGTILQKVKKSVEELKGSYALAILDKKSRSIVATRKKSPLYVAQTIQGNMIASDIICFAKIAKSYYELKEGEFAKVTEHKLEIYDRNFVSIKPEFTMLDESSQDASKQGFEFFMEKEINEIPAVIKKIYTEYKCPSLISKALKIFDNIDSVILIGCGTAYHASLYGAKVLSCAINKPCEAYIASEYKYSNPIIKNSLAIFVSQSGETADTIGCATLLKNQGVKTLAITNVCHSSLAKLCDVCLPVFAGAEIAVASTKAYVAQILVLYILAKYLANSEYDLKDIEHLADDAIKMINIDEDLVNFIKESQKVFFIGRQFDSITAKESALKLKEISYKSAEGYPAGELKHGTIALIEPNTPVIVFATCKYLLEKTLSSGEEVRARGAKVIVVAPKDFMPHGYNYEVELPCGYGSDILSILAVIPFQLLAFKVSKALGYNPDKPRNLAKSVTVE